MQATTSPPIPSTELSSASGERLQPLAGNQRIALLDVLRGFALIGILLANIEWFSRPMSELGLVERGLTGSDFSVAWLVAVFVEGKFYKLFSLLFGMGFAVMLIRASDKSLPFNAMFSRRMLMLFAFGVLHATLLWTGDILRAYAIGGFYMLGWVWLMHRPRWPGLKKPEATLKLSLALMSLPFVLMLIIGSIFALTHDSAEMKKEWQERLQVEVVADQMLVDAKAAGVDLTAETQSDESVDVDQLSDQQRLQHLAKARAEVKAEREKDSQAEIHALTQSEFWSATAFRVQQIAEEMPFEPLMVLIDLLPIFLFGYWLIASGIIQRAEQHRVLFKSMAWLGLGIGLMLNAIAIVVLYHPASQHVSILGKAATSLHMLGQTTMAAGYLGFFVLLAHSVRWQRWLGWLIPMGRMALTNYLMQSVILSFVFYGQGFGLYDQLSRLEQMMIVAAILVGQCVFSWLWLQFFRYGPMEWLWRSVTYWQVQPIRRQSMALEQVVPTV